MGMDDTEAAFFARRGRRCCCFPWPSSASSHQWVGTVAGEEESWLQRAVDAVLKVREWLELVAGSRPHNFDRKLNYDALSYVLNFDEGHNTSPKGEYISYRDFSACLAAPPSPPSPPWTSATATCRRSSTRCRPSIEPPGRDCSLPIIPSIGSNKMDHSSAARPIARGFSREDDGRACYLLDKG
ncbi:hypothetical protein ABZP36_025578 [Zizania latifolia]